jgi:putative nucleotidyltransferase with HDIG domain
LSLDYAAKKNYSFEIRLASLLHDIGKPRSKRGEGSNSTFYGHEIIGARMTAKILERLRFSKKIIEKVVKLVRCHLFYYDTEEVTDSSVRRLIQRVGPENIYDLVKVREADRIGSGVPKAVPYRLRHFLYRVEKVIKEPAVSLRHLQIDGNEVMEILKIKPGPKVGMILNAVFEEVLDDPKKNEKEYLLKRAEELGKLSEKELQKLAEAAKEKYKHLLEEEDEEIKRKHYVR